MTSETVHIPILVTPIVEALVEPLARFAEEGTSGYLVDCTLGGGGHTSFLLQALNQNPLLKNHKVLSLDQDPQAIERARVRFAREIAEGKLEIQYSRFSDAAKFFEGKKILGLMADLGFSSDQLDDAERGLSFQSDGPLDMRLDPTSGVSCADFLKRVNERELEKILTEYGEERFSRRIASALVLARREGRSPKTTSELVQIVVRAIPADQRHGRIHAATRTFQALRIAVNGELEELDALLNHVILSTQLRGRIAILSFHSLEDRKVKQAFKEREKFAVLTKKPIEADEDEIRLNSRSRSAKLRIAERADGTQSRNKYLGKKDSQSSQDSQSSEEN